MPPLHLQVSVGHGPLISVRSKKFASKNDRAQRGQVRFAGARRATGHDEKGYALKGRKASLWIDLCIKKVAVKPEAKGKKTGTHTVVLLIGAVTGDPSLSPSLRVAYITI